MHRKATAKGQMSSSGLGPAISNLPIPLKAMFEPRLPLTFLPPLTKRKMPCYTGLSTFVHEMEKTPPPVRTILETPKEKSLRNLKKKEEKKEEILQKSISLWKPPSGEGDAYKTLFVGRLSYEITENQLRREMEQYGKIVKVQLVLNNENEKPRGYAFVEFEKEEDMKVAFRKADGKKMEGRRIVVDVERGRTVQDWKPRRLGGGIGETRKGGDDVNIKYSGREAATSSSSYARRDSTIRSGGAYGGSSNGAYGGGGSYGGGSGAYGGSNGDRGSYGGSSGGDRYGGGGDRGSGGAYGGGDRGAGGGGTYGGGDRGSGGMASDRPRYGNGGPPPRSGYDRQDDRRSDDRRGDSGNYGGGREHDERSRKRSRSPDRRRDSRDYDRRRY